MEEAGEAALEVAQEETPTTQASSSRGAMMRLILVRHAKSDRDDPSLTDHDRPLNKRGLRQAPLLGMMMKEHLKGTSRAIVSTAVRAQETWNALALLEEVTDVHNESNLYMTTASTVTEIARLTRIEGVVETLILVGHNPTTEHAIRLLTNESHVMRTSMAAVIEVSEERAELVTILDPRSVED